MIWQNFKLLFIAASLAIQPGVLVSAAGVAGSSRDAIPAGWLGNIPEASACGDAFWKNQKLTLWRQVVEIAGAGKEMCNPTARYVAFVPTNAALTAFMASMGFERGIADISKRPGLAKELLAMHLVLALPPDAQQRLARGGFADVPTESQGQHSRARVKMTGGGVLVTDGQDDTAHVLKVVRLQENKTVVILDRVLMSGRYYTSFARLCNHRPTATDMCTALFKGGILHSLATTDFANTVFVPGNRAFAAAGINLTSLMPGPSPSSSAARTALLDRIRYHVVPGLHPIPGGFKDSAWQDTLFAGRQLQVVYQLAGNGTVEAFVVADAGRQKVPVVVSDVYVGQAIAHGITSVLQPQPAAAGNSSIATEAAAAGNTKAATSAAAMPKAGATGNAGSGRRLLGFADIERVLMPMNKAETDIRSKVHKMTKEQEDKW